jgi:outer membrane biosynthesis protein TonB
VIQAIISAKGEVTQPLVFQDLGSATLAYSALEAVRQWKFEPAHLDGKPVSVLYNLKIYYRRGG